MTRRRRLILWLILTCFAGWGPWVSVPSSGQTTEPVEREAPATLPAGAGAVAAPPTPSAAASSPASAAPGLSPALPAPSLVAVIRVEGLVYDFTLESIRRRTDRALQGGASMIVFDIDTNGGLLEAAF